MEQFEQPLRRPEKLLKKIVLPDETIMEIHGDPKTNEATYLICKDGDEILEYADLRAGDDVRNAVRERFAARGIVLTTEELNDFTSQCVYEKLDQGLEEIDEHTATEQ